MSQTIKFCHLSDLHISHVSNQLSLIQLKERIIHKKCEGSEVKFWPGFFSTYERAKFEALSRFVYKNRNEFDFVLISGDISSSANKVDLEKTYKLVDSKKEKYKKWTAYYSNSMESHSFLNHEKIIMLPGNHDRITHKHVQLFDYSDEFDNYFKDYWASSFESKRVSLEKVIIPRLAEPIYIIKVDFSLYQEQLENVKIGKGYVHDSVISELTKILIKLKEKDRFYIFVLHYPPKLEGLEHSLELENEDEIIELLDKEDVPFIFSGHSHFEKHYKIDGINTMNYCSDSTLSLCDNSNINIFTLDIKNKEIIKIDKFSWCKNSKDFIKK